MMPMTTKLMRYARYEGQRCASAFHRLPNSPTFLADGEWISMTRSVMAIANTASANASRRNVSEPPEDIEARGITHRDREVPRILPVWEPARRQGPEK